MPLDLIETRTNYRILDLVGRGQFGRVYTAIERQSGMLVALKELNIEQLSTSSFLRELTFLVTLDHFNIVTCKAIEHKQNKRYLVMDYCEGGTLRELLNRVPQLSLTQSLQLVIDVLHGLEFAHARGVIHRDIKPENILLKSCDRGYSAHLADFGIAKLNQQLENNDVLGNTGSPAYMAPEQFYGDYSYNCDLYGLGIVLYELVVGERPFLGMPKDLLAAHLSRPVIIPPEVPLVLRLVIERALRKFPQYRFQNATEMRQSLQLAKEIIESDSSIEIVSQHQSDLTTVTVETQFNFDTRISNLAANFATSSEAFFLATENHSLYQGMLDLETSRELLESTKVTFEEPICNLQVNASGCLVTTSSCLYYQSQIKQPNPNLLPLATLATEKVPATADAQGSWLAVACQTPNQAESKLNIYQLPSGKLKRSLANSPPFDHLIALDSRYAIGLRRQDQGTEFQLFNRRGNLLANFTLQIRLATIAHNPLFPNYLLATEINNPCAVILIKLRKFQLQRIPLEIEPNFIPACSLGYLVSDRHGKMIVLNTEGKCINKLQISLASNSEITAIATSPSKLVVATSNPSQSQLQICCWNPSAPIS